MKRIKLEIAYDGTGYFGWQTQANVITIEEVINNSLSDLLGEEIKVIGASRTDSGVHAIGNVAVFDTNTIIPVEKIAYALNRRLPRDIQVQSSVEVDRSFHPRKAKNKKTYQYRILNRRMPIPTQRLYSHFLFHKLDEKLMQKAGSYLVGSHDYKSFCSVRTDVKDTRRTIYNLDVTKQDDTILITVEGNGFLYNMVRIIVGTLIDVGREVYPPSMMKDILEGLDRSLAGPTAPAKGLTLVKIDYENDIEER